MDNHASQIYCCLFAVLTACMTVCTPAQAANATQIIYSQQNDNVRLSHSDVLKIFTGNRQYWDDGSKITVFMLQSDMPLHKQFCREQLRMFPYQLDRLWNQITYSGQGDPPTTVNSERALINAVLTTPGAIGYASPAGMKEYSQLKAEQQ
ncbi:hypothetical protein OCL06_09335 [Alteromonas sp. ASW11-19]|uniref:PBP domain-containing protein n=2 Tax=Alteromonas salexigens TaxID=2982530 RepID=A0ABT2VRF7_9ALTE|nr:hypothetical protein [Alteromonas salexigens]